MKTYILCWQSYYCPRHTQRQQTTKPPRTVSSSGSNRKDRKMYNHPATSYQREDYPCIGYSRTNLFSETQLISVFDTGKHHPDFTVKEEKESIILSTRSLHARVSLNTGEIGFTDPAGNPILNENEGGGKHSAPSRWRTPKDTNSGRYSRAPTMKHSTD